MLDGLWRERGGGGRSGEGVSFETDRMEPKCVFDNDELGGGRGGGLGEGKGRGSISSFSWQWWLTD